MKTHKAIIDALTVIINNWDQLELPDIKVADINNIKTFVNIGICGLVSKILHSNGHEIGLYILYIYGNQWREEFYGTTEEGLQSYWVDDLVEFATTENHFTNIKRLHACIWIRNKLIDTINEGNLSE